jgi:tRNA-splicing ligase RtcB
VRVITTNLRFDEIKDKLYDLVCSLFANIPAGVGSKGALRLSAGEEKKVLENGAKWAVDNGYGYPEDLLVTEDEGKMEGADPGCVSDRALERGKQQLGTLGSGNHFLEIEVVEEIFDENTAASFGLKSKGQVVVVLHSGSRGLGYQVCDDFLVKMVRNINKLKFTLPDRQLACAFIDSDEGRRYFAAMACAANYAWANRQVLMHWTRKVFESTLQKSPAEIGMRLLYDVCHNIAKIEKLPVDGKMKKVCVHRKGATSAFPPEHPAVPSAYRKVGQPVIIPGDMGSGSYILAGTEKAFYETFGSTCHGAGRVMSRNCAKKASRGRSVQEEMKNRNVIVMATGKGVLHEEIPEAYKDIDAVVDVVHGASLSKKVAKLKSIGCIKG